MSSAVDVDEVLDRAPVRGFMISVVALVVTTIVLDGLDIQIIGLAAGALVEEFQIDRRALSPALAASLLGMAIGGFLFGRLGDRRGRRHALLLSTLLFGATTLLIAWAESLIMLAVLRFLTGLGLGGALVNGATLLAELFPRRWRSLAVSIAIVGVPLGGMLGAAIAGPLLENFGWRGLFAIGGSAPLVVAGLMYFLIPESPRFLALHPQRSHALAAVLNRIEGGARFVAASTFVIAPDAMHAERAGVRAVFAPSLRRDSLLIGLVFFASVFAGYSFFNWMPLTLTSSGIPQATMLNAVLGFNSAGVVAALANSWVIARVGSREPLMCIVMTACATLGLLVWLSAFGRLASDAGLVIAAICICGASLHGLQVGMYAVAAHLYPTHCRAAGIGWGVTAGRFGGIVSAFAAGVLLVAFGAAGFFAGVAMMLVLALIGIALLRRHVARSVIPGHPG